MLIFMCLRVCILPNVQSHPSTIGGRALISG
jgi:hypothetical protein